MKMWRMRDVNSLNFLSEEKGLLLLTLNRGSQKKKRPLSLQKFSRYLLKIPALIQDMTLIVLPIGEGKVEESGLMEKRVYPCLTKDFVKVRLSSIPML